MDVGNLLVFGFRALGLRLGLPEFDAHDNRNGNRLRLLHCRVGTRLLDAPRRKPAPNRTRSQILFPIALMYNVRTNNKHIHFGSKETLNRLLRGADNRLV